MRKSLVLALCLGLVLMGGVSFAADLYFPLWEIGPSSNPTTNIFITSKADSNTVTITYFNYSGGVAASTSKTLNTGELMFIVTPDVLTASALLASSDLYGPAAPYGYYLGTGKVSSGSDVAVFVDVMFSNNAGFSISAQ